MQYTKEVNSGLKRASKESRREGKWATPPEVRNESNGVPRNTNVKMVLDQLVKENKAEKKRGELLYRPAGGGAGGMGNPFADGYRSPDRYDYGDRWNEPTDTGRTPTTDTGRTPTTQDTVKTAIGTMIVGGAMPSTPSSGTIPTRL